MTEFKRYLVSYNYEGAQWNVEVPARSYQEASERLGALRFAKVEGELVAHIPAFVGFLAPLTAWVRNWLNRA